MNKSIFFLVMLLFCTGCTGKRNADRNIAIELSFARAWKADIKKDIYTIFYDSKPPLEIKLGLTEEERSRIIDAWYAQDLDQLSGETELNGNCRSMPKLYTILRATTTTQSQKITIDARCEDFSFFSGKKAERVKKFIQIASGIILSKPAVRAVPSSDVPYM